VDLDLCKKLLIRFTVTKLFSYGVSKTILSGFETTTYLIANYTCVLLILLLMKVLIYINHIEIVFLVYL